MPISAALVDGNIGLTVDLCPTDPRLGPKAKQRIERLAWQLGEVQGTVECGDPRYIGEPQCARRTQQGYMFSLQHDASHQRIQFEYLQVSQP